MTKSRLQQAFKMFDIHERGEITKDEIEEILGVTENEEIGAMITEII
jgi:Ca2+-binding EF-hand superfamily protein